MSHEYKKIAFNCDLCEPTLIEAAKDLAPSRVFTLHVGAGSAYWGAKELLYRQHKRADNPLQPYINLAPEPDLKEGEWYLEDEKGGRVGSPGAMA